MAELLSFAVLGTISLLIGTWQDFRNNMQIDDRRNYFMSGVAVMLLILSPYTLVYKFILIGLAAASRLVRRYVADGDISAFRWIILGAGSIDPLLLAVFMTLITLGYLLHAVIRPMLTKETKTPFYHVVLVSFIGACAIYAYVPHI